MKVSPIIQAFNGGEWTPRLYGRTELPQHKNALRTCFNAIPMVQGPWTRRPGTHYVAPTIGNAATRLKRFKFSTTQAYALEFGALKMRVYKNNAAVLEAAQSITDISQTNPAVVTYSGADNYANGDEVEISGVVGMVEVNNRRFTVANVNTGANTFELAGVNAVGYTAYSSGGTVSEVYTVTTPWALADVFQLKFTQSADVLYVTHPSYAPRKITRTGDTAWTITEIDFLDGPYLPINNTATTLGLSATSGSVTVTASAGVFAATDTGRLIRWRDPANNWTWLEITGWTSTTQVTATIRGPNASAGTATTSWRLGVWSATTGYPGAVAFFEDRLFLAGATNYPQRLDGSKSGDYENFAPTAADGVVADDNAVAFTLNSADVNAIRWMLDDEKGLIIGTSGGEWQVKPATAADALGPTNISAKQSTSRGSANAEPVRAGRDILFIQKSALKLCGTTYLFEDEGYKAVDKSILAEHMPRPGLVQIDYQQDPQSIVWGVRADGALVGVTYERSEAVNAWHRHAPGGVSDADGAAPKVKSVATVPAPDGTRDEVWLTVQRYIDGGVVHYVEYLHRMWEHTTDAQEDAFFLDCGATYDSTPTTTIRGLYHLRGQTVQVLADGATQPDVTVSATGAVTLTRSASVVHLGYNYDSDGETMNIEAGAADGTAQGKTQRIHRVAFRVLDTLGLKFGRDFDNLNEIYSRTSAQNAGEAVPLYTGDLSELFDGGYQTEGARVCWRVDTPFPATILAVMPALHTMDR